MRLFGIDDVVSLLHFHLELRRLMAIVSSLSYDVTVMSNGVSCELGERNFIGAF